MGMILTNLQDDCEDPVKKHVDLLDIITVSNKC